MVVKLCYCKSSPHWREIRHIRHRLAFDVLEQRNLLSVTANLLGNDIPVPDWIPPNQIPVVQQDIAAITADTDPTATGELTDAEPANARQLIGLNAFSASFPGYAGTGSIVILDSGIDLANPK